VPSNWPAGPDRRGGSRHVIAAQIHLIWLIWLIWLLPLTSAQELWAAPDNGGYPRE
jgi:hypothetical protein